MPSGLPYLTRREMEHVSIGSQLLGALRLFLVALLHGATAIEDPACPDQPSFPARHGDCASWISFLRFSACVKLCIWQGIYGGLAAPTDLIAHGVPQVEQCFVEHRCTKLPKGQWIGRKF